MANARRDAGAARQRPGPPDTVRAPARPGAPVTRPAGPAPVYDAAGAQLTDRAGQPKGMHSNPWVAHWTGRAPAPTADDVAAAPATPDAAPPQAAGGADPRRQRTSVDAGAGPAPGSDPQG